MDLISIIFGTLIGLLAGVFAVTLFRRGKEDGRIGLIKEQSARERADLEQRLTAAVQRERELQQDTMAANALLAAEQERVRGMQERLENQRKELEELQKRMTSEFENIASRLLETKGRQLNEQQQERLGVIMKPLQERIKEFEEQVRKAYETEGRERFALKQEIVRLVEQNQRLSQEANDLTKALKGDTQAQGAWGEMILEKLLESSGLIKGQEYTVQDSTTLADGSRLRPDAVINLPENKHLIIDSKVSLVHYERYSTSTDETERAVHLKQHVESLRTHAKGLGEKNYGKLHGVDGIDFVLMFVPLEPAFLLALRERPEIFQEAYDRQVVMVTHTTLMATLRTIHGIWKHERIARNHIEIAERAGALYEKFVGFTDDLIKVGQQMDSAKRSYVDAMGKLNEGRGNLVRQVELLKKLGAKTNKTVNPGLLARALEEPEHP